MSFVNVGNQSAGNFINVGNFAPASAGTVSGPFSSVVGFSPSNATLFGSSFSPLSLSPVAWFRSDLGVNVVSGLVAQWNDQSGNNYNCSNASSSYQPSYSSSGGLNNLPRVTWSAPGSSQNLQNSSFTLASYPVDVFVVATCNFAAGSYNAGLFDLGDEQNFAFQEASTTYFCIYNGTIFPNTNYNTSIGASFVAEFCNLGSASSFISVNGANTATGDFGENPQSAPYLTIGCYYGMAGDNWGGDIYELIIFNHQLSTAQRHELLAYVQTRYGIIT